MKTPDTEILAPLRRRSTAAAIGALVFFASLNAAAQTGSSGVGAAIFYTASATIIIAFFLITAALKNLVGVAYAALFAVMLALVWALEGGVAAAAPTWSEERVRAVTLFLGLAGAGFGFLVAERAIDPRRNLRVARRLIWTLAAGAFALAFVGLVAPAAWIGATANALLLAMFAAHVLATSTWRLLSDRPSRSALAAAALILFAALAVLGYFLIVRERQALIDLHVLRALYALAAAPTMAVIVINLVDIRRAHTQALKDALASAQRDAETSAKLLEMEKNYSRARDVARARRRKMSTLSHDIMQPVASMRAELDALKSEISAENIIRLDRILSHFSSLTADLSEKDEDYQAGDESSSSAAEPVPAALALETLQRMFAAEAKAKGVDLRIIRSTRMFRAPATALMRLAANLVSNALNHAGADRILVGVRSKGDDLVLVVMDDGRGLGVDGDPFAAGVKGEQSGGDGLGLSIVKELCDRNGWSVTVASQPGAGVAFAIVIPAARQGPRAIDPGLGNRAGAD